MGATPSEAWTAEYGANAADCGELGQVGCSVRHHCRFMPGSLIRLHEPGAKTTKQLTPRNVAAEPGPQLHRGQPATVISHCPGRRRVYILSDAHIVWIRAHHFSWREEYVPDHDARDEMAKLADVAAVMYD
jgi:hypothetical protein